MDRETQWRQQRGTLIGVTLAGVLAAGTMAFAFMVCGGFAIWAVLVVLGFTALGCLHYLVWGRSMMNEVADERRAEEMRRRLEAEAWPEDDDPHEYRRF